MDWIVCILECVHWITLIGFCSYFIWKGFKDIKTVNQWFRRYLVSMYNMVNKEKPLEDVEDIENILELDDSVLRHIGLSDKEYFDWGKLSKEERTNISLRLQMMENEFGIKIKDYKAVLISLFANFYINGVNWIIEKFYPINADTTKLIQQISGRIALILLLIGIINLKNAISLNVKIHERKMFAIYLKKRLERYEMLNMNREAVLE